MFKKSKSNTVSEPPELKPYFYEDWGCAVTYFRENLARIRAILELEKNLREDEENANICRLLLEFSTVLLVSAFKGYFYLKVKETPACKEDINKIQKPSEVKILIWKRNHIIHRNSKVSEDLRKELLKLNQEVAINAKIPLGDVEIKRVMGIMREMILKFENSYPSPVNWGEEGLKL